MNLVGKGNRVGNKSFSLSDAISVTYSTQAGFNLPDNWYEGMVKKMYLTSFGMRNKEHVGPVTVQRMKKLYSKTH
jgi:hypothetical protein